MIAASPILIIVCYITALVTLYYSLTKKDNAFLKSIFWLAIIVGAALHLLSAANISYVNHSFNFSVASMSMWISALIVCTLAIGSFIYPIKNLSLIVLPIVMLCIIFAQLWGDQQQLINDRNSTFYWHIATAVAAFTLLSLSVLQALLFGYQELSLRKHQKNIITRWLPPIQTMENVLFKTVFTGFVFLSISISLGSIYNYELNKAVLSLNHHTVLAILSWFGFAILLYGRIKLGWRGLKAINWTLIAFALLGLGYFGTKIISEFLAK